MFRTTIALLIETSQVIFIMYFVAYSILQSVMIIVAFLKIRYYLRSRLTMNFHAVEKASYLPSVSIVIPAYNEGMTIAESVASMTQLNYPRFEIIIVNDGSTDSTMASLRTRFGFSPKSVSYHPQLATAPMRGFYEAPAASQAERLILIDKENGGKADALNAGINAAQGDYVCCTDADSIIERNALLEIVQPILAHPQEVVGCGGQVGIANGHVVEKGRVIQKRLPKKNLVLFQLIEYVRTFTISRTFLSGLNSLLIISGVFGIYRRDLLVAIGGYLTSSMNSAVGLKYVERRGTVGEDFEIVVRLYRYIIERGLPYRILFVPTPIAWTEAPETVRQLAKQRDRWYRGLAETLWIHRTMFFNPIYRQIGLFAFPYYFFFELMGPLMELAGYVLVPILFLMGRIGFPYVLLFFALAFVYATFLNLLSMMVGLWKERGRGLQSERTALFEYEGIVDVLRILLGSLLIQFGYFQAVRLFQFLGFLHLLRGRKGWEKFERKGFAHNVSER